MRILKNLLCIMALCLCSGCTQNNGNIGFWFGTWRVTQVTIDGTIDDSYANDLWFKFQADVCDIVRVTPHHGNAEHFCKWHSENDDKLLILDFTFSGSGGEYDPIAPMEKAENIFSVDKENSRNIKLTYGSLNGQTYVYTLKKE